MNKLIFLNSSARGALQRRAGIVLGKIWHYTSNFDLKILKNLNKFKIKIINFQNLI